jgi:hypothetical protein
MRKGSEETSAGRGDEGRKREKGACHSTLVVESDQS